MDVTQKEFLQMAAASIAAGMADGARGRPTRGREPQRARRAQSEEEEEEEEETEEERGARHRR